MEDNSQAKAAKTETSSLQEIPWYEKLALGAGGSIGFGLLFLIFIITQKYGLSFIWKFEIFLISLGAIFHSKKIKNSISGKSTVQVIHFFHCIGDYHPFILTAMAMGYFYPYGVLENFSIIEIIKFLFLFPLLYLFLFLSIILIGFLTLFFPIPGLTSFGKINLQSRTGEKCSAWYFDNWIDSSSGVGAMIWCPSERAVLALISNGCMGIWHIIHFEKSIIPIRPRSTRTRVLLERQCRLLQVCQEDSAEPLRKAFQLMPLDFDKAKYCAHFREFFEGLGNWVREEDDYPLLPCFEVVAGWFEELNDADGAAWARERLDAMRAQWAKHEDEPATIWAAIKAARAEATLPGPPGP